MAKKYDHKDLIKEVSDKLGVYKIKQRKDFYLIKGKLSFHRTFEKRATIQDNFDIEIFFPKSFPENFPVVKEIGNRIPRELDYHINPEDSSLCLATYREMSEKLHSYPSFSGFIEHLVIPFLYSFSFKEKNGKYPYGERKHGGDGILEDYKELFGLNSDEQTKRFLEGISKYKSIMKKYHSCPCGSNQKFRDCHTSIYKKMKKSYSCPCGSNQKFKRCHASIYRKRMKSYSWDYFIKDCLDVGIKYEKGWIKKYH